MNQLQVFNFTGKDVRVIMKDGHPWWVAKDVCDVLEIRNSRDALGRLDDDEKGVVLTDTLGGAQQLQVVNESGLYSLVLSSRKPESKKFKRWVTHEVLPAIRQTGTYSLSAA
ncbi:Bro-N domain-containing protein, partial [Paenibacillus larvae]